MKDAIRHLDQRFATLRPFAKTQRPPKGWLRAIRDALGMTTSQFAKRLDVSQPRVIALEKAEVSGVVSLETLQRAAEALGCRLVYALVPEKPLAETVEKQAELVANRQLASVQHSMALEDQAVKDKKAGDKLRRQFIEELMHRPARLWDEK
jgi:predicted DNA-binding mobile mystery protein A